MAPSAHLNELCSAFYAMIIYRYAASGNINRRISSIWRFKKFRELSPNAL